MKKLWPILLCLMAVTVSGPANPAERRSTKTQWRKILDFDVLSKDRGHKADQMRKIVASLILVGAIATLAFPGGDGLRVETKHRQFTLIGAGAGRDEFVFKNIDKANQNQEQAVLPLRLHEIKDALLSIDLAKLK